MSLTPYYQEPGVTIFHGDCRDILPQLSGITAIVSDPPYGMAWDGRVKRGRLESPKRRRARTRHYGVSIQGDAEPFTPGTLLDYPEVLLWGFNHFPQALQSGSVLVWLKRYDTGFGSFLSDAELAWFNRGCGVYCRRDLSLQAQSATRVHPMQKPLGIMTWCLSFIRGAVICDPYMGSGTTLEAAKVLGRRAIGIEVEERYCQLAVERLRQGVLPLEVSA